MERKWPNLPVTTFYRMRCLAERMLFSPRPFRQPLPAFFFYKAHYRSIVDLSEDALLASEKGFQRLSEGMEHLEQLESSAKTEGFDISSWEAKCYQAMNDDFNSPLLIAQLFDAVKFINAVHNKKARFQRRPQRFTTKDDYLYTKRFSDLKSVRQSRMKK